MTHTDGSESLVLADQEEVRCLLHACEAYVDERMRMGKLVSRAERITGAVRELLSRESIVAEHDRSASSGGRQMNDAESRLRTMREHAAAILSLPPAEPHHTLGNVIDLLRVEMLATRERAEKAEANCIIATDAGRPILDALKQAEKALRAPCECGCQPSSNEMRDALAALEGLRR